MIYKFSAYGHPHISGAHNTTLEFSKDDEVTPMGDCIVGIKADFDLEQLKQFIKKCSSKKVIITITTPNKKIKETIFAELNPSFSSDKELVIRKSGFCSERTFAINADKAASGIRRELISFLKERGSKICIMLKTA